MWRIAPSWETKQVVTLQELRMDPGRVGLATVLQEMARLRRIRQLHLPADLFAGIAHKVLAVYRNRAGVEEPSRLHAHDMWISALEMPDL